MEALISEIQAIFSRSWNLGAEDELDKVLAANGWVDGEVEMSFSNHYYRTRIHPTLGEFRIELESAHNHSTMRVEIRPVDCDGFSGDPIHVIRPTPEQAAWIDGELAKIHASYKASVGEDEYDFLDDEEKESAASVGVA